MKWRTICIDPPWSYTQHWQRSEQWRSLTGRIFKRGGAGGLYKAGERGAAAQYDCMTLAQIAALPVADWAEDDAHLYLWVTNAFVDAGFDLMRGWGFQYKTMITWRKNQIGMGLYFRNSTEHVLFGVRGKLKLLRRDLRTDFEAPRGRHSEKPDVFYDLVEMASPGPWLEVFARRQRFGWECAGNEVYSVIPELSLEYQLEQASKTRGGQVLREDSTGSGGVLALDSGPKQGGLLEVCAEEGGIHIGPSLGGREPIGDRTREPDSGSPVRRNAVRQPRSPRSGDDAGEPTPRRRPSRTQPRQDALREGPSV